MGELRIEIVGPGAEHVKRDIEDWLRAEFGIETRTAGAVEPETGRKIDSNTLALIAIILALPGAINSTMDLAKRIELTDKVKRLLARVRGRKEKGARIVLVAGSGRSHDLDRAEAGEVVETLTEPRAGQKAERRS